LWLDPNWYDFTPFLRGLDMGEHVDERESAVEIGSPAKLGLGTAYLFGLLLAAVGTAVVWLLPGSSLGGGPGASTADTVADAGIRTLLWSLTYWFLILFHDRQRIRWARLGGRGVELPGRPLLRWDEVREVQVLWLHRRWGFPWRGPAAGATHAKIRIVLADPRWSSRTVPSGGSWLSRLARHGAAATGPVLTLPTTTAEHARSIADLAGRSGGAPVRSVTRGESFRVDFGWPALVSLLVVAVFVAVIVIIAVRTGR
jgi:hypothetical protein